MDRKWMIIVAVAVVAAALVFWPRTKPVPTMEPDDAPVVSARPVATTPADPAPAAPDFVVDTGTSALPPLNRELVIITDSDMQNLVESRRHLINRPDPL